METETERNPLQLDWAGLLASTEWRDFILPLLDRAQEVAMRDLQATRDPQFALKCAGYLAAVNQIRESPELSRQAQEESIKRETEEEESEDDERRRTARDWRNRLRRFGRNE